MCPENANVFFADDLGDQFDLKKYLGKSGHNIVIQVKSLPEAIEQIGLAKKLGVTVAILDEEIPDEGDGKRIAESLRAAIPGIKIISFCGRLMKPPWSDFHFSKAKFSYENATRTLPDLIRSL